ncbi:MAG: hypothetical protein ACK4VW_10290, partial [Anaerolineales bacterium]
MLPESLARPAQVTVAQGGAFAFEQTHGTAEGGVMFPIAARGLLSLAGQGAGERGCSSARRRAGGS